LFGFSLLWFFPLVFPEGEERLLSNKENDSFIFKTKCRNFDFF